MADFLDDLIGIQKEFKSITDDIASETADLRGATVSAEPVWTPSDYKVVPKGNSAMCVRCKNPEASCDLCQQVCPTDSIWFDDDGSIEDQARLPQVRPVRGSLPHRRHRLVHVCPQDALRQDLQGGRGQ